MTTPNPPTPRILRRTDPSFFPSPDIVAVHDQVDNIVYFNIAFDDPVWERRALFIPDDNPVLRLKVK